MGRKGRKLDDGVPFKSDFRTRALMLRTSPQMRAAIEAEAERTGRSMSAVCEIWLEFGRHWINHHALPQEFKE